MSMFGHNPFSWVPLRAESIINFKSEGDTDWWRSIPDSTDTAPAGYDDDTHEDNGWTADRCEAAFFLFKGSGDQIGIAYPANSSNNTGEWWKTGATSMTVNGYQAGEIYKDAYTRVLMIVGNHWDGDTDEQIETINTIAQPAFGNAKWSWISDISDLPTNCAVSQTCSYSNWSEWSPCDKDREPDQATGKDGTQTRTRTVTSGSNCDGELTQTQDCISPQPCEWGEWGEWSAWFNETTGQPVRQIGQPGACHGHNMGDTVIRTRTRSVVKPHQGGQAEDLCPDGITEDGWGSTQTETETKVCATSASGCASDEEWNEGTTVEDGVVVDIGYCGPSAPCQTGWDETTTETDAEGCKTGCKTGYEDINLSFMGLGTVCHIVGCTDPTANNYDANATLACNSSSIGTKWKVGAAGLDGNANANKCCEYDCDNPLLKTDWNGQCKDECIDGYEMDSTGNCVEQCNEGFELIDGECKKSPKKGITTQTDDVSEIELETTNNMIPIIGGLAVLGIVGALMMRKS